MAVIDHEAELARAGANVHGWFGGLLFFARRYPLGAIGALIMILFVATAIFADGIATFDPFTTNARISLAPPGGEHCLGADFMGRDVFARIVYGARISLAVGVGATALGCLIGVAIGLMSGFFGGWFDLLVQRLMDIMQSLPLLVMALVMAASLGPSLPNTIIAIAIPLVPNVARIIRSNTLVAARDAVRGGGARHRHERDAHRHRPRAAQHAGAADRAGDRAARLGHPGRSRRWRSSGSACRSRIPPGAACCRSRPPSTCAPRPGS